MPKSRRSEIWRSPATRRAIGRELLRLGGQLRALREAKGWTLEQAAEKAGVHAVSLSRVETGSVNVTIATLVAVTRALGVSMADLFDSEV